MKIVIIHGQKHKQITYHIGRKLVDKLETKENITEFFLPTDMPYFCNGCYTCMLKGEEYCPHYESLKPILKAIDEADVLVFTTPVYCFRTTGSMKAFLDHCFTRWISHRPKENMYYKKAIIISVAGGMGMRSAASDIKISLRYWGISNIKVYKLRSLAMSWKEMKDSIKSKMEKDLDRLTNNINNKRAKVTIQNKIMFLVMRKMQLDKMGSCEKDYEYWKAHGWLEKKRPWKKETKL